jgi:hypothetical protein
MPADRPQRPTKPGTKPAWVLPTVDHERTEKQWWAPVWKGLVVDSGAKHYRAMKNALWLYLYLLLHANRKTGVLMRKLATVSRDMGVTRDTALRWLNALRRGGYVETVNTGRSLTIRITRWKGVGRTRPQEPEPSASSRGKYPTPWPTPLPRIPPRTGAIPGFDAAGNETKKQRNKMNDPRGVAGTPGGRGFTGIGAGLRQELLAQELARGLDDAAGINLYRSYSARYPEWLLRKALAEVEALPAEQIRKGRGALFNYLVQHHAKRITDNPGS